MSSEHKIILLPIENKVNPKNENTCEIKIPTKNIRLNRFFTKLNPSLLFSPY